MSYILSYTTLGPVWFTAMKTDGLLYTEPNPSDTLIFPDNISTLGPGFDPVTSVFTAPVPGLYFFTTTLRQYNDDTYFNLFWGSGADGHWRRVGLRRDLLDATTIYNTATIDAIVNLSTGDTIDVALDYLRSIHCLYCNFDGYLLHRHM